MLFFTIFLKKKKKKKMETARHSKQTNANLTAFPILNFISLFFFIHIFALETSATIPATMPIYYICLIVFFSFYLFLSQRKYKNKARLRTPVVSRNGAQVVEMASGAGHPKTSRGIPFA